MADDEVFSVDLDALQRGGVNLNEIAQQAAYIYNDLSNKLASHPHPGGDGAIGKAVSTNYDPSAQASMDFLKGLKELLDTHGGKTLDLSNLFNETNSAATNLADHPVDTTSLDSTHGRR